MKKTTLLIAALAFSSLAHAEGKSADGAEFFYKAPAGKSVVTPFFNDTNLSAKIDAGLAGTFTHKESGYTLGASYGYGLSDDMAFGVALKYAKVTTKETGSADVDSTGIKDLEFTFNGTHGLEFGILQYGATLSLSPGDHEIKASGDSNQYSGGYTLRPYVGLAMSHDKCFYGAKLSTDFLLGDKSVDDKKNATKPKDKGGEVTELALYYEHHLEGWLAGGSLAYQTVAKSKDTVAGATTTNDNPTPLYALNVYGRFDFNPEMALLPKLTYVMTTDNSVSGNKLKDFSSTGLEVAFRMVF